MTGADSPVMADSSTEATPSITSPSLGIRSPASTSTMSPCLSAVAGTDRGCAAPWRAAWPSSRSRSAQGRGLRLAAAFGDRFGEIGEQHGEPQPEIDLER
jgi:hypothetical protein